MDTEARRDLQLLEAVEQESTITQRSLSARLQIALGLTNLYVRRLIRKGYVKCVTMPPNRVRYAITPRGAARKARLTLQFMKYSLDLYRQARKRLAYSLRASVADRQSVAVYGTGEAAELACLLLRELGVEPVAVFDGKGGGSLLGFPVLDIEEHRQVPYDVLLVASLENSAAIVRALRTAGVPKSKLLLLRDQPMVNGGNGTKSDGKAHRTKGKDKGQAPGQRTER